MRTKTSGSQGPRLAESAAQSNFWADIECAHPIVKDNADAFAKPAEDNEAQELRHRVALLWAAVQRGGWPAIVITSAESNRTETATWLRLLADDLEHGRSLQSIER